LDDNEKRVGRLANLVSRLYDHAPSIGTNGEHICQRDFVEIALLIGEQGEGQYRTSTINSKLSTKYDGLAPTKLPPEKDDTKPKRRVSPATAFSRNHRPNGEFRSLPTEWIVEDWVEETATLASELGLEPANVADLAEESQGLSGSEGQGLETALAKALDGDREGDGGGGREGQGTDTGQGHNKGRSQCPTEDPPNRGSERSDRFSGADVSHAKKDSGGVDPGDFKTRGSREKRRYLDARVRMQSERFLFLDLMGEAEAGMYTSGEDDAWTIKPAKHLREDMGAPRRTKSVWEDSVLIECKDDGFYDPERGLCREMRVYPEVVEEWAALPDEPRRWWLHTPKPKRTHQPSPLSSDLQDENNHNHPEPIDKALRSLECAYHPFDLDALDEAIESLERKGGHGEQLAHLRLKRKTIRRQADGEEGVVDLQNAYTPDDSGGRITFKKGGPQGLMKAVKAKAYDIEGITNWDIKSCHTSGLRQWADVLAGLGVDIDTSPLDEYPGKDKVVEDTGLPRGLVKTTEHSVKNSAYLPASLDQAELIEENHLPGDRTLDIADEARDADVDTDEALRTLHEVFADYRRVAIEIAEALLTTYWDEHKQPGGPKGWCMKNHCGVSFYRSEVIEDEDTSSWCHKARTAVMAWALRGLEGAFCHALTNIAEDYDYEVAANEHDGLIVHGRIPDEDESDAIERARERSGFHRAEIVEKPFADEEDIQEVYGDDTEQEPQPDDQEQDEQDLTAREREQRRLARYNAKREIPNLSEEEMRRIRSGYETAEAATSAEEVLPDEEGPQPPPGAEHGAACVGPA
jgi:hypothetical protein